MWTQISKVILKKPRLIITLVIFCCLISALQSLKIETAQDSDFYTVKNHEDFEYYEKFKKIFGNDEILLVTLHTENIFTKNNIELINELTEKLETLDYVDEVTSLTNVEDIVGEEDSFYVDKLIKKIPTSILELKTIKKQTLKNKMFLNSLISKDGKTTSIVITPIIEGSPAGFRRSIIEETKTLINKYKKEGTEIRLAGWTLTNYYLIQNSLEDILLFIPITAVLIIAVVFLFFKSKALTLIAGFHIIVNFIFCSSIFVWSGIEFNNVTGVVFPILLCLSLADCVHIFSSYQKINESNQRKKLLVLFSEILRPCFFTSLTTGIGFASLMFSDVPPIYEFGMIASISVMLEFVITLLLLPPLLLLFNPKVTSKKINANKFFNWVEKFTIKFRKLIVAFTIVLIVGGIFATFSVSVNTNLLDFFKSNTEIIKDLKVIETDLGGVSPISVSLRGNKLDVFKSPNKLLAIENLQNDLEKLPKIDFAISLADFLKDMHSSFNNEDPKFEKIPNSQALVEQYLLLYDSNDIEDIVNPDFNHTQIALRTSEHSTIGLKKLIPKIESLCKKHMPKDVKCKVTGENKKFVVTADALIDGQISSIITAFGIVLVIMIVLLRSVPYGLFSLIPNMLPLLGNFIFMALFDIPLNTGTALISSVAFGIAVDDTIHFLEHFCKLRRLNTPVETAIRETLILKGSGIVNSSLILAIGFAVLGFGQFLPVVQFGLLTAAVMISALIADIFLIPALLLTLAKIDKNIV